MEFLNEICEKRCGEIVFTAERKLLFICLLCDNKIIGSGEYLLHILIAHNIVELNESDNNFEKEVDLEITSNEYDLEQCNGLESTADNVIVSKCQETSTSKEVDDEFTSETDTSEDSEESTPCQEQEKPKTIKYSCEICSVNFRKLERLEIHRQRHNPTECLICSEKFSTKFELKYHRQTKHPRPACHLCPMCGLGFTSVEGCKRHMLRHKKERKFKCEICGKAYYSKSYMKHHMKSHGNVSRDFICFCGAAFNQPRNLKKHMKRHENKREHICHICGYGFTEKGNLTRHMRIMHKKANSQQ